MTDPLQAQAAAPILDESAQPAAQATRGAPVGLRARLMPRPALALALWLTWLMLQQSLAPAHLLLGGLLALVLSAWAGPPPSPSPSPSSASTASTSAASPAARPDIRRPLRARLLVAVRLFGVVVQDIVLANLEVARLILGRQDRLSPGFVNVPLTVRDPRAVSLLAAIVTMTPGTVSAELSDDRTQLQVHALDLRDPQALVSLIRERYERPVLELMS